MIDYLDHSFYEAAFGNEALSVEELQQNTLRVCSGYVELLKGFAEALNRVHYHRVYWDRETRIAIMHSISSMAIPSIMKIVRSKGGMHGLIGKITNEVYVHLREQSDAIDIFTQLTTNSGDTYRIREQMGKIPVVEFVGHEDEEPSDNYDGMGLFEFLRAQGDTVEVTSVGEPQANIVEE